MLNGIELFAAKLQGQLQRSDQINSDSSPQIEQKLVLQTKTIHRFPQYHRGIAYKLELKWFPYTLSFLFTSIRSEQSKFFWPDFCTCLNYKVTYLLWFWLCSSKACLICMRWHCADLILQFLCISFRISLEKKITMLQCKLHNNTCIHEKITWLWLAESSAVQV